MTKSTEQTLIDEIDQAFSGVRLEDGISLNMTKYNDSGGSVKQFEEKARFDERDDWHRIPDDTLEKFTVTFSFTDLKGFRFYIPAYMIWTLRNHRKSDSIIGSMTIYAIDPDHYIFGQVRFFDWFSMPQIVVMVKFLEYCCANEETLDDVVARENLQKISRSWQ